MAAILDSSNYLVCNVLGEEFVPNSRRRIAASQSGHGVVFGAFRDEEVAAKLFVRRNPVERASHEERMTKIISKLGFSTLRPIGVYGGNDGAVLLTHYVEGLIGGNSLPIEAAPDSRLGKMVARIVTAITIEVAKLNNNDDTHGDPQLKNFGLRTAATADQTPLIFDLEKATEHGKKSDFLQRALCREMQRLTFSLGVRQYGGPDALTAGEYLDETVLVPYAGTLDSVLKRKIELVPVLAYARDNFQCTREKSLA